MKKYIINITKIMIILFLFISCFFVFGSQNANYNEYLNNLGWFRKLTTGTLMEGVRYIDYILPSGYAYIVYMALGIFFLYPVGDVIMVLFMQTINIRKELVKIKKQDFSEYGEKAGVVRANKMIDVLEENNFSISRIIWSFITGMLGLFFWTTVLSSGQEYFSLMKTTSNFLWFDLNGGDWLYIVPGLLLFIQVIQMTKYKGEKTIKWFKIMISLSTLLILLPSILFSSIFGLFLLMNNLYFYIIRKVDKLKNEKRSKNNVNEAV